MHMFGDHTLRSTETLAGPLRCWFLKTNKQTNLISLSLEKAGWRAGSWSPCRLPGHPAQWRSCPTVPRLQELFSMNWIGHGPDLLALLMLCLLVNTLCNSQHCSWPWGPRPYFTHFSRPGYVNWPTGFTAWNTAQCDTSLMSCFMSFRIASGWKVPERLSTLIVLKQEGISTTLLEAF